MIAHSPVGDYLYKTLLSLRKYWPSCRKIFSAVAVSLGKVPTCKYRIRGWSLSSRFWALHNSSVEVCVTIRCWEIVCTRCDRASTLPWSFPGRYWMVKSYPCRVNADRASLPVGSRRDISHFRAWWSTTTVKWLPASMVCIFELLLLLTMLLVLWRSTFSPCLKSSFHHKQWLFFTMLYLSEVKSNTISTSVGIQCEWDGKIWKGQNGGSH